MCIGAKTNRAAVDNDWSRNSSADTGVAREQECARINRRGSRVSVHVVARERERVGADLGKSTGTGDGTIDLQQTASFDIDIRAESNRASPVTGRIVLQRTAGVNGIQGEDFIGDVSVV